MRRDPVKHAEGVVHKARQHQMPQQHAARHLLVLDHGPPHLPVHFEDRRGGGLIIIRRGGQALCKRVVAVFEVGEIDVDLALEPAQGLHRFVAAAVVDDRNGELRLERGQDRRKKMRRRDEVDVLHALVDQPLHRRAERLRRQLAPEVFVGDRVVLAEGAPQRAAGEEDRAASEAARNDRLLPVMGACARGIELVRHTAKAAFALCPVHAAAARAERTVFIGEHRFTAFTGLCIYVRMIHRKNQVWRHFCRRMFHVKQRNSV